MRNKLTALILAVVMLFALASCSGGADLKVEGVWALEAEDIYFFIDSSDTSWTMLDAVDGTAIYGDYKIEGEKIVLYSDGQVYLELFPFDENVLEFDGGMLGYMFALDDPQAIELMKPINEAVG